MKKQACATCQFVTTVSENMCWCRQFKFHVWRQEAERERVCRKLCTGNYYTCQIDRHCPSREECHVFARLEVGGKPMDVVQFPVGVGHHYEVQRSRVSPLKDAAREAWKRGKTKP